MRTVVLPDALQRDRSPRASQFLLLLSAALLSGCEGGNAEPPLAGHGARELGDGLWTQSLAAEFGTVFEGSVLEREFELEVRSPLSVTAAKTDCGCTVARLERASGAGRLAYELGTALEAGAQLFVKVRYDTQGRSGPTVRSVTLTTDTGRHVPLTLTADVRPWLVSEPPAFDFVRLLEGETDERSFQVRSAEGQRFMLRATRRGLPDSVQVELAPEEADDSGRALTWRGTVRLGADVPRGTHSYPIELESDVPIPGPDAAGRRFTLAPAWDLQVLGPVALSAPSIDFGLVRPDETLARTVRLESFDPGFELSAPTARLEPLHAKDAFPLARTASVRARAVPGAAAFDLEVVLAGLDPEVAGTFLAKLVVETGHPELARLEALVRGVRAPAVARR